MTVTSVKTDKPNLPAVTLSTGGRIAAIVPQTFADAVQMAGAVVRAGMAPKSIDTVEKATVAILQGLELGLTPMAALQSIAVINGTPSVYGDGMLALVRGSGLLEDFEETMEWAKDGPLSATCRVKRAGEPTWGKQTITRADAERAGWWRKAGPWTAAPQRMLQMRARGWALRDKFADVLRGLRSAEEMEDLVDVTSAGSATTAEPRREDFTEAAAAPPAAADAPAVTDVVDQAEIVFEKLSGPKAFFDFSDHFLQQDTTTPDMARKWEEFYRDDMNKMAVHDDLRVRQGLTDTIGLYSDVIAREEPEA